MEAFIRGLPKAELHLHIEGTLEPELMFTLAEKHGIALPYTIEELRTKRSSYADLQDFLNLFYAGCSVLIDTDDFYQLARAYFARAVQDNVKYAEVFFDPQSHMNRGISFDTVIEGLVKAVGEFEGRIEVHLIMSFLRHLTEESAISVIEAARPYASHIWGIGLDSTEIDNRPSKFQRAYALAESAGLCGPDGSHKTAHCCEEGDPSYGTEALDVLRCKRIDHGIRALEDENLVAVLRERQIPITVCPWSNEKLKVNERFFAGRDQPALQMLAAGLLVSVNSDDPAYFGKYLADTMLEVLSHLSELPEEERKRKAKTLAENSFKSAFLSEEQKNRYLDLVAGYQG